MLSRTTTTFLVGALLCATACQKTYIRPPPGQTVELGGLTAEYHDYGDKLCQVDPRVVANELKAMNAVLLKYVDSTSAGFDGVWADEHAQILEQGQKQLPAALKAWEPMVKDTARCKFDEKTGIADLSRRGEELVRQSRARVEESRELLPYAKAKAALTKWKNAQPAAIETARDNWCPKDAKRGSPDLFYVSTNEEGITDFLFCDGSKVVRGENRKYLYVSPDSKRVATRPYIDEAQAYPSKEIQVAPRLPERPQPHDEASSDD